MTGQWRRQHERISCYIPILLRFVGVYPPDGWGVILDISLGGLKIETRSPILEGDTVFVSFMISDEFNFVNAKCNVSRTVQNGVYYTSGLRFADTVDKQHLSNALQLHLLSNEIVSTNEAQEAALSK